LVNSSSSSSRGAEVQPDAEPGGDGLDLLADSLGYAIKRAQVRTYEVLFGILGPDALSPGRMTALCIIANQPGVNQTVLAEMLGITRAGVVKVVDTLQSLGYVERRAIPNDRRSYALAITNEGRAELARLAALTRRYEEVIASRITQAERRLLIDLLEKIAAP